MKAQGQAVDALLAQAEERRRAAADGAGIPVETPDPDRDPTSATPPTAGPPASASPTSSPLTSDQPETPKPPPSGHVLAPPTDAPTPGVHPHHDEPFLVCTRARESGGNYAAYNPGGPYLGAYQFLQSTWNSTANHAGRPELVGVRASSASPYDQDDLAWALYQWQGSRPWGGHCDE